MAAAPSLDNITLAAETLEHYAEAGKPEGDQSAHAIEEGDAKLPPRHERPPG